MCVTSADLNLYPFSFINEKCSCSREYRAFWWVHCTGGVCLFEPGLFCAEMSSVDDRVPCQNVQCWNLSVCKGSLSNWRAVCQPKRFICWKRRPLCIETASLVSVRGHCTVVAELSMGETLEMPLGSQTSLGASFGRASKLQ